jgi:hypothetical protein
VRACGSECEPITRTATTTTANTAAAKKNLADGSITPLGLVIQFKSSCHPDLTCVVFCRGVYGRSRPANKHVHISIMLKPTFAQHDHCGWNARATQQTRRKEVGNGTDSSARGYVRVLTPAFGPVRTRAFCYFGFSKASSKTAPQPGLLLIYPSDCARAKQQKGRTERDDETV